MKRIINIRLYTYVIIGLFIILTNSCKTDDNNNPSILTDFDGNVYHTMKIGTQVWMVENLKATHYRNGDLLPNVTNDSSWTYLTTGAQCDYGNKTSNGITYGKLYNWYAVHDSRNLCPTGWHVPSDLEWTTLTDYLGGENFAGGKLKEIDTNHWFSPNTGATNLSGFTALPAGYRNSYGLFYVFGEIGYWWSTTESTYLNSAYYRSLFYNDSIIHKSYFVKNCGYSVRCIKDN
jgi:uncharacterized protein (TIGR02145 family)